MLHSKPQRETERRDKRTCALCFSEATVMCCAYSMCERRRLFFSEWLLIWYRDKAGKFKRSCFLGGSGGGGGVDMWL